MQSTTWMLGLFPELSIVVFLLLGFFSDVSAAIPSHKHSPPRISPFISIPLVKLHHPKHSMQLHDPAVVHKKHATHGSQRLALMSGRPKLDSALASLRKPNLRHSALRSPLHVRKRLRHLHVLETRDEVVRDAGASAGQTSQSEAGSNSTDDTNTESDSEVTKAHRPNCPHCAGLDIEANDIGYLATLRIGTPPQDFRLLVDSGSADMWVGGERCKSDAGGSCGRHKFLGPQSSSSFNNTRESWAVKYGSGSVSGDLVTDHVEFAGTTLKHHKFGIARNESSDFTPDIIPLDGMLGCAKSIISNQRTPSLVDSLFAARLIDQPIISYKISRLTDGKNDGEITMGGMDPSKYDASSLVRVRNINKRGFWEASLDAVRVNGKDLGLTNRSCIFDTGTTLFIAPQQDVATIHRSIPGAKFKSASRSWTIPCTTNAIVSLTFGKQAFRIESRDLAFLPEDPKNTTGACMSAIAEGGVSDGPQVWLIGDIFMKNVYWSSDGLTDMISIARLD